MKLLFVFVSALVSTGLADPSNSGNKLKIIDYELVGDYECMGPSTECVDGKQEDKEMGDWVVRITAWSKNNAAEASDEACAGLCTADDRCQAYHYWERACSLYRKAPSGACKWRAEGGKCYLKRLVVPPTVIVPSGAPLVPTPKPTALPPSEAPSASPTTSPSLPPTSSPTTSPTSEPTIAPTPNPSASPTSNPTTSPTANPSASPTSNPTISPTADPTTSPTPNPTFSPTPDPTAQPTVGARGTATPTAVPTVPPTAGSSPPPAMTRSTLPEDSKPDSSDGSNVHVYLIIVSVVFIVLFLLVILAMRCRRQRKTASVNQDRLLATTTEEAGEVELDVEEGNVDPTPRATPKASPRATPKVLVR